MTTISIAKVLFELEKAAALGGSKTLYDVNYDVYEMLRYGVKNPTRRW